MGFISKVKKFLGMASEEQGNDPVATADRGTCECRQMGEDYYLYKRDQGSLVECGGPYTKEECEAAARNCNG